jgi:hypothetical protein
VTERFISTEFAEDLVFSVNAGTIPFSTGQDWTMTAFMPVDLMDIFPSNNLFSAVTEAGSACTPDRQGSLFLFPVSTLAIFWTNFQEIDTADWSVYYERYLPHISTIWLPALS